MPSCCVAVDSLSLERERETDFAVAAFLLLLRIILLSAQDAICYLKKKGLLFVSLLYFANSL